MKIAEMETQIDKLGLEKLEVKVKKGREVDIFICAIKDEEEGEFEDEEQHRGNLVVFDSCGRCWETTPLAHWIKGEDFEVIRSEGLGKETPESINGYELERIPERDLEDLSA